MSKADVLRRVRQNLFSERSVEHPFTQEISTIADGVTTSITVNDGAVWEAGDTIEIVDTGEQCYVRSVATNVLTVIRGFNGTTAAATTSSVPLARKNPQFTEQEILDQYNHILAALWGHGVWQWKEQSVAIDTSQSPFQPETITSATPKDIIGVHCYNTNGDPIFPPFRLAPYQTGDVLYTDVQIYWPHDTLSVGGAEVQFIAPITDIDTQMFHPEVEQALENGVTYRVLASTMASRLHDPGLLTDRTVQPGQGGRDARFYQGEYVLGVRRIAQELKVEKANRRVGQDYGTSRARRWRV